MIGISSFAYHDMPLTDALENIERMAPCAEIFSEGMHDLFKNAADAFSYNLKYTVHSPTSDINIASIREPIRKASLSILGDMADICAKMDASVMVVHPGYFSYPSDRQVALKAFGKSVPELENISRETGVKICIENMPMWECFLFREPGLNLGENAFALDVGHANTMGNLRDFLELDISHFHLHDNNGENDDHYHIGGGNIDYSMLENTLKNRIRAVKIIENKNEEDVMKSMAALKKMGVD